MAPSVAQNISVAPVPDVSSSQLRKERHLHELAVGQRSRVLGLSAAWYPNPDEDFFLKIALGVASLHVDVPFPRVGAIELTSSDFGATVGIGRDFRITERFAITAFGDILFTPRSSAVANGSNSGAKISADMVHAGLAITIP